jgi:holliday junction DNA helicase RuvA
VIGRISGILVEKAAQKIVVDCLGLGYELETSLTTFLGLPDLGEQVSLYTHLTIRDDAHLLYGFANDRERGLFRSLLKVNGVGTKVALVILSGMNALSFAKCEIVYLILSVILLTISDLVQCPLEIMPLMLLAD